MGTVQTVETSIQASQQNVPGAVDIIDQFDVTSFTIKRAFSGGGSTASITGIVPQETELSVLDDATAHDARVELEVTVDTTLGDVDVRERIFTGVITKVTKDHRRRVTIECMDRRELLNRHRVTLDTRSEGETTRTILQKLFREAGLTKDEYVIDIEPELSNEARQDIPGKTTVTADGSGSTISRAYGVEQPVKLFSVLADLARIEDAALWIDRYNDIHFETVPDFRYFEDLPYIVSLTEGSEQSNKSTVIVDSTYDSTGLGAILPNAGENRRESASVSEDTSNPYSIDTKSVHDISAQRKRATAELSGDILSQNSGRVKVVGQPYFEPNDQVDLVDIPEWAPLNEDTYTIKSLEHKLDPQTGFTTTLDLGRDLESLYDAFVNKSTYQQRKLGAVKTKKQNNGGSLADLLVGGDQPGFSNLRQAIVDAVVGDDG